MGEDFEVWPLDLGASPVDSLDGDDAIMFGLDILWEVSLVISSRVMGLQW